MKKNTFRSRGLLAMLFLTPVLFTQCQKDDSIAPDSSLASTTMASASDGITSSQQPIDLSQVTKDSGYAYYWEHDFGIPGDSEGSPSSTLTVYENGKALGPAHSSHSDIRSSGEGRFSHWKSSLYFSSSDNTNPSSNGRKYTYSITTASTSTSSTAKVLDLSKVSLESGYAYYLEAAFGVAGDSHSSKGSTLKIFENGKELGPAHSSHRDIRSSGQGRFSHWGTSLYFSTSDNSNPKSNGRTYTYTIDGSTNGSISTSTAPTSPVTTSPEPTSPAPTSPTPTAPISSIGPIGYAMVNGSTTGGQGGQTVTVTSLSALKSAVSSSSPLIIQVSGNLTGTGMINVSSNKTIIGLNGATLNGVGLAMYGVSNIIIKNMKISKVVGGDGITIKQASHHIWVDHNEIWQDRDHGWDHYDELLEVTDRSDYVTVSNNKFHDSHMGFLIGSGDQQTTDIGHLRVTIYGNYFYNLSERQPRTRFGYMHVFNNYFLNGSGYAIGVSMDATVRTDNNYFENQNTPIDTDLGGAKPGKVSGASTNIYKNSGANSITTSASSWVPTYEYKSILISAAEVSARVMSEAGPKY